MPFEYNCTVERIIDGDTVDVLIDLGFSLTIKQRIRLMGIDTPEVRTRDLKEKYFGVMAKERLKELLSGNIVVVTKKEKGKYGRILGTFYNELNENINQMLVDERLAVEYFGQNKYEVKEKQEENMKYLLEKYNIDM